MGRESAGAGGVLAGLTMNGFVFRLGHLPEFLPYGLARRWI